jgi:2-polyprenyl-6-methoxyphenol hydroxylase-like FAD-dependent oxidoreductase
MKPADGPDTVASLPASTQVVVAGGGPVGLAAAVDLGRRGIQCLVVEPRADRLQYPSALQDDQRGGHRSPLMFRPSDVT